MKLFKKILVSITLLLTGVIGLSSLSYAIFVYNDKNAELEGTQTTSNLVNFTGVDSDYYRIYFFASPYYATGGNITEGHSDSDINTISSTDETDPKAIADSEYNPYNDTTTDYWTGFSQYSNSSQSNFQYSSGNYTWVPMKSISQTSAGSATVTPYKKADFTGYIRENKDNDAGLIIEKTHTYYSIVVEGQITASQLTSIVATSEYKDAWGFGPEFVGWSYDKASVSSRILSSSTSRAASDSNNYTYTTSDDPTKGDTSGTLRYVSSGSGSGTKYKYGNFGRSSDIKMFSDSTSLQYIDNYTSDSGNSIDGSKVGDKVIYLYPVFGAKQNSGLSEYHNLIKFRRNPGSAPQTKQSDEIDYSQNRLTRYFLYDGYDSSALYKNNYSITDYYLDFSGSTVNRIDMAINSTEGTKTSYTQSYAGYGANWPTLISDSALKSLGLESGYYDIRLCIWYASGSSIGDCATVFKVYYEANYFDAILYSHSTSGDSTAYTTLTDGKTIAYCPYIYSETIGGVSFYYVIGLHKQNEHHLTGDNLNGNISDYDGSGYRRLPLADHKYSPSSDSATTEKISSLTGYFFVENVELYKDEKFTILDKEPDNNDYTTVSYSTGAMEDKYISNFNTYLTSSYASDKTPYYSINRTDGITSPISINESDNKKSFISSKDGIYSLLFTITYKENSTNSGINVDSTNSGGGTLSGNNIESINIAYKEVPRKYKFIVLSDPSKRTTSRVNPCDHSVGYEYIYDDKAHWARCQNCGVLWTSELSSSVKECDHIGEEKHTFNTNNECTICGYKVGESSNFAGAYYNSYNMIFNFDSYVCSGSYDEDTIINMSTVLTTFNGGKTLYEVLYSYWGKELVDMSTGLVFNYRIFNSNTFKLNRNYVLYIRQG